jgi:NAD(P)H-hydrate epimerase
MVDADQNGADGGAVEQSPTHHRRLERDPKPVPPDDVNPPRPPLVSAQRQLVSDIMFPRVETVPFLTTEQMIEVDRAMVEEAHIDLLQMMENAGRDLAQLARVRFLEGAPVGKRVAVLAGTGGNGGGAMVCARRLHTWGAQVQVVLAAGSEALAPATARQRDILERIGVPVARASAIREVGEVALVVDGIIGYRLSGAPREAAADLIRWANAQAAPVLALDVPSGIDATTGVVHSPAIRATATMTLALPKVGLRALAAADRIGELYLADIGVPPGLYARLLAVSVGPLFARDEIVRLT